MFCKYCGAQMPDNAKFCQSCGGKVEINENPQVNIPSVSNEAVVNTQPTDNGMTVNNSNITNNTPMNNVPNLNNRPKSSNGLLLAILILVGVCAIVIPIVLTMNKDKDSNKEENKVNEETNIKTEEDKEEPNNQPEQQPEIEYNKNTTEVEYNGYTFKIPTEYTTMDYEGNFTVLPADSSWLIMLVFSEGNFDDLKMQIPVLDAMLGEQYENASSEYKTYQGQEYILTSFTSEGAGMQMILTDAGNDKILLTLMMPVNPSVSFDDLFSIAFPIATSVKYEGTETQPVGV